MTRPRSHCASRASTMVYLHDYAIEGQLRCHVEALYEATVISVYGPLRRRNAPQLVDALRNCLAEIPQAIILDLSATDIIEHTTLNVLSAVNSGRHWWPGTELILVVPPAPVCAVWPADHRAPFVRCFVTRGAALAAAAIGLETPQFSEHIRPWTGACWQGRKLVDEACGTWGLLKMIDPARLLVTELVSNGVRHASTDIGLSLIRRARWLHLGVSDRSDKPLRIYGPNRSPKRTDSQLPQGLLRVDAAATDWGVTDLPNGKIVWARLRIPPTTECTTGA